MKVRDKDTRQLLKAVKRAGGRCEPTARGRFLVYGPSGGIATIAATMPTDRHLKNTLAELRRAGIDLR